MHDTRTTTTERILGGEFQTRVMQGRAKVGDGNSHESYSSKASKVKDHTLQGHFIRLGPILRICSSAKSTPAWFKTKEKFGYLLEMVRTKGNKIIVASNLVP